MHFACRSFILFYFIYLFIYYFLFYFIYLFIFVFWKLPYDNSAADGFEAFNLAARYADGVISTSNTCFE